VPAGPYTAIAVPVQGYASIFPYIPVTRFPSGGADPGWYDVADISLSDGGNSPSARRRCSTGRLFRTVSTTCASACATAPPS
jgi:hypothetical protein